jgi:uncharacterized protein with NRDE domain
MCTVVVAADLLPGFSLVVLANRDEHLDRPATAPFPWEGGFLAPKDLTAGGTWLGINRFGVFVAITNRSGGSNDPARRTRGALVVEALGARSARDAHHRLSELPASRHNGFHLVCADARDTLATISDGAWTTQLVLGKGFHAVTERSFGAGDDRKRIARIEAAWHRVTRRAFSVSDLATVLCDHDAVDPLAATCVHVAGMRYGTRSSMVLGVEDSGKTQMLWAEGPPCTTSFGAVDVPVEPEIR